MPLSELDRLLLEAEPEEEKLSGLDQALLGVPEEVSVEEPAKEPTFWEKAWGTVTEAPSNLKEAFLKLDEYTYYEPLDVSKWIPKATEALGNTWTWAVRFLPGNEDLPDWEDQTEGQKIWTSTQATAMVGAVTEAIRQGISVPKAIRASGRMKRIAKMPTTRAEALKEAGKKVEITRGFAVKEPEVRLKPIKPAAGAPSITREVTAELHAIKPAILKTVKTLQFKDTIHKQLYDLVSKYKPSPTSVDMEPFYKTADALTGTPLKGLINPAYSEVTYNQINKVLPFMLNQLVTSGKATAQIKEVAPEEQIVDTEMGRKLTPTPEEYAAPEVAPKAEIPEAKPEVLAEEITPEVKPPTKPPIPPIPPPVEIPEEPEYEAALTKLNAILKKAKPIRGEMQRLYGEERAKRFGELEQFLKESIDKYGAVEGYKRATSIMGGPLISEEEKAKLPQFTAEEKLTDEELKVIMNKAWKTPYLTGGEKLHATSALIGLSMGDIPQPRQLELLEEVYGSELVKNILTNRAWGLKVADFALEVANVPRLLMTMLDMSGLLRQDAPLLAAEPSVAPSEIAAMHKFAFSPKAFRGWYDDLRQAKDYLHLRDVDLAMRDPQKVSTPMADREEMFMSRILQQLPLFKIPVGFTERAYVGLLAKTRVDVYRKWATAFDAQGLDRKKDFEKYKSLATLVNTLSGRGDLGPKLNRIAPLLNATFFAPRFTKACFDTVANPVFYINQPKEVRVKAMTSILKYIAAGVSFLGVAKLALGDKAGIELDPTSADWGKLRIGDTRYDIWGGHQQIIRTLAQLALSRTKSTTTGKITHLSSEEFPFTTHYDVMRRFVESKFSPSIGLLKNVAAGGKTFVGEEMTVESVAYDNLTMMWIQDVIDAYKDGGIDVALPAGGMAFYGSGVQTYGPRKKKKTGYWWK